MAQRTIHYLFGELFSQAVPLRDKNRFLLGSILPDAFAEPHQRDVTHFTNTSLPGNQAFYDFGRFREQFAALIACDDLYLGYYMHLVEDNFFRQFIYSQHGLGELVRGKAGFTILHDDYHRLNAHIVTKYDLTYGITRPDGLEHEPLYSIVPFTADSFLEQMRGDFNEQPTGSTRFLTEALLDEFLEKYLADGIKELRCVSAGGSYLDPASFAWVRKAF